MSANWYRGKGNSRHAQPIKERASSGGNLTEIDFARVGACKYCGNPIAFLDSSNGKKYPVNYVGTLSSDGARAVVRTNNFHNCKPNE